MTDRPKGTTIPKQRLAITNIEVDVAYSGGTKFLDRVHAINLSLPEGDPLTEKPIRMTIFNGDLKTFVRGKTNIVADIEERPRPESEFGPDRTIVQVYDAQGEPVSRKQFGGGGGGNWKRSLEDDLVLEGVKRVSIEGQTAVAQVGLVLTCPTPVPGEDLGIDEEAWKRILGKYWKAVEKGLDNYLAVPPKTQAAKPVATTATKPPQTNQGAKPGPEGPAAVSSIEPPPPDDVLKNVGDLLNRCRNYDVPRVKAFEILGITDSREIGDLDEAWAKVWKHLQSKDSNDPDGLFSGSGGS